MKYRLWLGLLLIATLAIWLAQKPHTLTENITSSLSPITPALAPASPTPAIVQLAVPTSKTFTTPAESAELRFAQLTSETLRDLPTIAETRRRSAEDLHHSEWLYSLGERFGQLVEMIEAHPELREAGAVFFRSCASNPEALTSVRALCLSDYARYGKTEIPDLPERVKEIARAIDRG